METKQIRAPISSRILTVEEVPAIHPRLPAAGWIVTLRTGSKRWCPVMVQPVTDSIGLVKELRILHFYDQFRRNPEFVLDLEVVSRPNTIEQLSREIELDLPKDQAQQDDFYYEVKKNTVEACMDVFGAIPYITGNSHPFRKLGIADDHFRTVNPQWDRFAAHRTGRKLRSAWKNGIPWQAERQNSPGWGIWRNFKTLIAETELHQGPRHDAVIVTRAGMKRMRAEMPFSSDRIRNDAVVEEERQVGLETQYGPVIQSHYKGYYPVERQTMKLMAACGVQGMSFVIEHDLFVDGEPVEIIISPEMVNAKSAWTILTTAGISLDEWQAHVKPVTREGKRISLRIGEGILVDHPWTTTSHNEIYHASSEQTLAIRPEQHFCAGIPVDPLQMINLREVEDLWNLARAVMFDWQD